MFDVWFRKKIDPALNGVAGRLKQRGILPNQISYAGFMIGMLGALCLATQHYPLALICIVINRIFDGLDGALARTAGQQSEYGGYLDIVLDFIFYSAVIFAFAYGHPEHALAAAFLIFSFMGTGSSFLAYAILAEKRGVNKAAKETKTFLYARGLAEGGETVFTLMLICLFPAYFTYIAVIFGSMCWVTTGTRILDVRRKFKD